MQPTKFFLVLYLERKTQSEKSTRIAAKDELEARFILRQTVHKPFSILHIQAL